jgi:hypothetical protein
VFLAAGCAPTQRDVERSIRDEMKSSLNVEITRIDLTRQSDGSYTGTATASNGYVYEVMTEAPRSRRTPWKAVLAQVTVERLVREDLEAKLHSKVKTLALTRESFGLYTGTAELENGQKVKIATRMEGNGLRLEYEPQP